jgi:hypothetical protein
MPELMIQQKEPEWNPPTLPAVIETGDEYAGVAGALKRAKETLKHVEEWFEPHVQDAHATWKRLTERRRNTLAPIQEFEAGCKRLLVAYDTEQERLRQEEQRRLEEEARRQEEARRLEEAAALEAEGIAEGDESKITEAEELIAAPVETPVVSVQKATPQVQGLSFRETWNAKVTDPLKLIQYVAQHPEFVNLLTPNATALRQMAQSLKGNMKLPGVSAYSSKGVAAR